MGRITFSTSTALALAAVLVSSSTTIYAVAKLPKHSVGAKQLKPSAVTNSKISKDAVSNSKISKYAVTSSKVKPNALGGTAINESALGQVPSAANAGTAGNAARLEGLGAAAFVGAPRMAFGKGTAASTAVTTVLTLPNVGMSVTTDGDMDTDPVVIVNLPPTVGFQWIIATGDADMYSVTGTAPVPISPASGRQFTAHIWRADATAGVYLHCTFDTGGFTSARPFSCWAFST